MIKIAADNQWGMLATLRYIYINMYIYIYIYIYINMYIHNHDNIFYCLQALILSLNIDSSIFKLEQ